MTNPQIVHLKTSTSGRTCYLDLSTGSRIRLPVDIVLQNKLSLGSSIGPDLTKTAQLFQLQEYALSSLALSSQLEKPLRFKLRIYCHKHQLPNQLIDEVINYVYRHKLINPIEYISNYQTKYPYKSIQRLKFELGARGADRQLIDQLLNSSQATQANSAQAFIRKKHPTLQKLTDSHQKQLILASFIRNGFSYSVAKNAIDDYLKSL